MRRQTQARSAFGEAAPRCAHLTEADQRAVLLAWSNPLYQPGPVELASCSFGQSSKVSYLQMLTAVCAIVNGGSLMQPYVVQRITAPDGTVVQETEPVVKRRVLRPETSETMRTLMEGVVTSGTGKNAAMPGA